MAHRLTHRSLSPICARVCREAGARVTTNTLVRDLNAPADRLDDRRIEVIANGANGLPPWNGAQLAVDTSVVSPSRAMPFRAPVTYLMPGVGRSEPTLSSAGPPSIAWSSLGSRLVAGAPTADFLRQLARPKPCVLPTRPPWSTAGLAS